MKAIVIYHSQTGFTRRYAHWIAKAAGADCMEFSKAKRKDMSSYDAVIFGGWACAGTIKKLGWFKSNIGKWADKKLIVFCVGASPIDSPDVQAALKRSFTPSELKKVRVFYCPGGLNYEKMPAASKLLMKLFVKSLRAKKDKTAKELEMIRIISSSYDISDRKYIGPILDCLGSGQHSFQKTAKAPSYTA